MEAPTDAARSIRQPRSMASDGPRRATHADVLAAPPAQGPARVGGVSYTQPRPAIRHTHGASTLGMELGSAFGRGRGGPGGGLTLDDPGVPLGPRRDVLVPDLAGFRRTALPALP